MEEAPEEEDQLDDMDEVTSHITGGKITKDVKNLQVSNLTALHNILHKLATTNWLPTTNTTTVTKDQAILIYKLSYGVRVNVGKLIFDRIWQEAETSKTSVLPYPSLIYQMLLRQDFRPDIDEYPKKMDSLFKIPSQHVATSGERVIDLPWVDPCQPAPADVQGNVDDNVAPILVPLDFLLQKLQSCNDQIQFFFEQLQRTRTQKVKLEGLLSSQKWGETSGTTDKENEDAETALERERNERDMQEAFGSEAFDSNFGNDGEDGGDDGEEEESEETESENMSSKD